MSARLIAVAGPLEGGVFPLLEGELRVGREDSNALCLSADRAVSRHHCVIEEKGEQLRVRDLDSANKTYVNDVAVSERVLEHGDEIRVGRSVFLFIVDGRRTPQRSADVELDEGGALCGDTVVLRREDAAYRQPEAMVDAAARSERAARSLKTILRVFRDLSSTSGLTDLQHCVMETIFAATPAQRGAILVAGRTPEDFSSAFYALRHLGQSKPFRIPRVIIQRIFDERAAVFVNKIQRTPDTIASESILQACLSSIVAVPVVSPADLLSAIYLDTSDPGACFTEDHLELLAGIVEVAATPLLHAPAPATRMRKRATFNGACR
jgi:FHA domain